MTKTKATLATIATVLAVPMFIVGFAVLAQETLFWRVVGITIVGAVLAIVIAGLCAGIHELWCWFRREGWRADSAPGDPHG